MADMDITKIADGADIELVVDIPTLNDTQYDARNGEWELDLWVFSNKQVKVKHTVDRGFESLGDVYAGADITDEGIEVYIKASKKPLGKGKLKGQMIIHLDNSKFEDEVQVVKTIECEI